MGAKGGRGRIKIYVKYHEAEKAYEEAFLPIEVKAGSDWIDLRSLEDVTLKKGEFKLLSLGVSIKLPPGYEAHIAPRSSTFKNWGILQTNSVGVVDESYCGENDVWRMPVLATRDARIRRNDRICQFRILRKMPALEVVAVQSMDEEDRGGFGSTGIR